MPQTAPSFHAYSRLASRTDLGTPPQIPSIVFNTMCMAEEVGESLGKIKKRYRDGYGIFNPEDIYGLMQEAGDLLWYFDRYAEELRHRMSLYAPAEIPLDAATLDLLCCPGRGLEIIAGLNLEKMQDRAARGRIGGSGDDR